MSIPEPKRKKKTNPFKAVTNKDLSDHMTKDLGPKHAQKLFTPSRLAEIKGFFSTLIAGKQHTCTFSLIV
jgi:hypothetical protein